jgi:phage FluMu gp28-like protein
VRREFLGRCKVFPKRDTLLLPYQARWVKDDSRMKLMEKGRQIGLSWSAAFRLVSTTSLAGARFDDWVSSRDDLQARLLIEDCKSFAAILEIGAEDLGERVVDEQKHSAYVLRYANGRQTHSLSSNADAQAGKRGRRVLDEFALQPDPRKLYSIAYHGITWGGNLEMISTHRGSANFFNELVQEVKHKGNPKGISLHTVTLQTALDDGFLFKLQSKLPPEDQRQLMDEGEYFSFIRAGCADEESFLQECMCVPADDNSAFLSYDLIAGCEYPLTDSWEMSLEALAQIPSPLYLGVDVGRDHDLTVMWLLEKTGGVFLTRAILEFRNTPFDQQEAALYAILRMQNLRRACIDRTGIGRQFTERAQQKFGEYRVEAVNFSGPVKEELAYPVRAAFEDRSLRIPNSKAIRADLRSIRKETTAAGNIRFTADRGKNGHADRFWGLALALHAGKDAGGPAYLYVVQPQRPPGFRTLRPITA